MPWNTNLMSIAESEVLRATGAPCYPQTTGFPSWHHLKFPRRMGGPLHSGCTGQVAMVGVVAGMQKHVTTMCLISRRIQWLQDVHCSPHSSSQGAPLLTPFKDSNQQWRLQAAPRCLQAFQHQLQRGAPEAGSLQRPWHQGNGPIIWGCLMPWMPFSPRKTRTILHNTMTNVIKLRGLAYFQAHWFKNMLESWDDEGTLPVPNNPQPLALSTTTNMEMSKSPH